MQLLTEQQALVRASARAFARQHLAPGAADRDREKRFPSEALKAAGEQGLMGIMVPEVHGGVGADAVCAALTSIELAAADGAFSTIISVHNALVCMPILHHGTDAQKAEFLEPLARGDSLGAYCLTEPGAGSDAAALATTARRVPGGYAIDGVKQFITSGGSADLAIVFARLEGAGTRDICAFLVPTVSEGYSAGPPERTMGQRSSDHCQIRFTDCFVPEQNRLGAEGEGMAIAFNALGAGRLGVAAQAVGMARAAYEVALTYAKERETFGQPIIRHQAIGFELAWMAASLSAAELMVVQTARRQTATGVSLKEAASAKLFATETAERICAQAIQTLGGYGYLEDFPVERIYRDVRVSTIYEGSSEIQKMIISREIEKELSFSGLV